MPVTAQRVPILADNYAWLLRDDATGATALVDPADAEACAEAVEAAGGRLDLILLTHHHADHVAGAEAIRERYHAAVIGNAADASRLPRLDRAVSEGDTVRLGSSAAQVFDTPGHTRGHICFYFPDGHVLLSADTLFSLGCGKLLEGSPAEMFASLQKLKALPDDTLVCCGHEYTETNARFALSVDPDNVALQAAARDVSDRRRRGEPTVPTRLGDEKAANPYLRAGSAEQLGQLRRQKDSFR